MLNKSSELSFKELYCQIRKACASLGVNLHPDMSYFEMFHAACERVSNKKLSEILTFTKDDDNWFFNKMQKIILDELQSRGRAGKNTVLLEAGK